LDYFLEWVKPEGRLMKESIDGGPLPFPRIELLGIQVDVVDRAGLLHAIALAVKVGKGGTILNANAHAMNLAVGDPEFRAILNGSDLLFVDGFGVVLGARLAGLKVGERLTFMDWMDDLFVICSKNGWPIFALGDTDEVGAAFEKRLKQRHPDCPFAGRHHGLFQKEGRESDAVVEEINRSGALILLTGMSMPIQEKWLWRNRDVLAPPVRLASGAFFRFYTGYLQRGPRFMTQNGLEWLFRLATQPGQLWRRYLLGNPLFIGRVIIDRLGRLVSNRS
jgi:N-acetylglucosaminyldiphosphoundecaprenol N-acetyl-beta-D-mannosaminyltransferase